jgi:plasmid replication initiation protein
MQTIIEYEPTTLVVQSNYLVNGRFNFTTNMLRIFLFLLLKIKKGDLEFKEVKVPCRILQASSKKVKYDHIKEAANRLTKENIGVVAKEKDGKNKYKFIPLMAMCEYKEGEGYLVAKFNDYAKPYLLDLTQYFTSAQFKLFMNIKSFYSYRVYWLLKQYEDFGGKTFTVTELKEMLQVESKYSRYYDFKRFVINQAHKELKYTDMAFEFTEQKRGRSIEKLKFKITGHYSLAGNQKKRKHKDTPQRAIDFDAQPQEYIDKNIRVLILMGFKKPEAAQIVNIVEDKRKLTKVLYRYEITCNNTSELNSDKIRKEFLDLFDLVPNTNKERA